MGDKSNLLSPLQLPHMPEERDAHLHKSVQYRRYAERSSIFFGPIRAMYGYRCAPSTTCGFCETVSDEYTP